jgi:hypothetical protein
MAEAVLYCHFMNEDSSFVLKDTVFVRESLRPPGIITGNGYRLVADSLGDTTNKLSPSVDAVVSFATCINEPLTIDSIVFDSTWSPGEIYLENFGFFSFPLKMTPDLRYSATLHFVAKEFGKKEGYMYAHFSNSNGEKFLRRVLIKTRVKNPTSILYEDSYNKFDVYPNPASEVLNISFQSGKSLKFRTGVLYNVLGNIVKSFSTQDATVAIDISELSVGKYFLHITQDDGVLLSYPISILR